MLLNTIQAELRRLQLHPANLSASASDDQFVTLRGSLLNYWKLPQTIEGKSLLEILHGLPDGAGPQTVMNALSAALVADVELSVAGDGPTALRKFDPATNAENSPNLPTDARAS